MDFSTTGDNLSILICTDYSQHSDWLSFASWYSIHKSLPSAKVAISCSRNKDCMRHLFVWTNRCNLKCFQHKNQGFNNCIEAAVRNQIIKLPLIAITHNYLATKELSHSSIKQLQEHDCLTNNQTTILFVKEKDKKQCMVTDIFDTTFTPHTTLQKFSLDEWNKTKQYPPFNVFWKFTHESMTADEAKVLNIWKRVRAVYDALRLTDT